ncbi:TetR/AcrR family transcriptional regulator [Glaciihabitans sp. UYNi722]|uniref:TetR/AcrR family transcriptional regulator n=1 Tax=Glaciihabitans sp. UYNi722 TaxID=3156344 RepID=UPI0033907DB6
MPTLPKPPAPEPPPAEPPAAEPRSRRDRPAKAPLSRAAIVQAGLAILDRSGIVELTMRRVAQELDTGAASLYVYVKNRDDLLLAMLDEAMGSVPRTAHLAGTWRERVEALIEAIVHATASHEGLALVALGTIPRTDKVLLIFNDLIGLLREGGLDDRTISWSTDLLYMHATAAGAELASYIARSSNEHDVVSEASEFFAALPAERYPLIAGMHDEIMAGSGDERDAWKLRVLLNGILATPAGRP